MTPPPSGPPSALFHFSEDPDIRVFAPRPVRVAVDRGPAGAWLNGPLVWAIDAAHSLLYLFPRDCPRIVIWPTARTSSEDRRTWFGDSPARAIAFLEEAWQDRMHSGVIHRYGMPAGSFEPLDEPGVWVSRDRIVPLHRDPIRDLPAAMAAEGVDLRYLPRFAPLAGIWNTTLHASGIRLRNAQDWVTPDGGPPRPLPFVDRRTEGDRQA